MSDLSQQADDLLRGVPQDEEYPFRIGPTEARRDRGRGRDGRLRQVAISELIRVLDGGPSLQAEQLDTVRDLLDAARLTKDERAVLVCKLFTELSDAEIGEWVVARSRRTAIDLYGSARKKVRIALERSGGPTSQVA